MDETQCSTHDQYNSGTCLNAYSKILSTKRRAACSVLGGTFLEVPGTQQETLSQGSNKLKVCFKVQGLFPPHPPKKVEDAHSLASIFEKSLY